MTNHRRIDKVGVLDSLRAEVVSELRVMTAAQKQTLAGATHEEARPENDKDTRALELSYLARGQAQRVVELEGAVALLAQLNLRTFGSDTPIGLTALVTTDDGDSVAHYFLSPAGGGRKLGVGSDEVRVITLQSPLGCALLGKHQGETFNVQTPQGLKEYTITEVI